jgi:hypothetical protein
MTHKSLRAKALAAKNKSIKIQNAHMYTSDEIDVLYFQEEATPDVILELLDRLERLESERAMMVEGLEFIANTPYMTNNVARDILAKIKEQK